MILLGIDPGIGGGLAIVSTDKHRPPIVEEAVRMPMWRERTKKLVDARSIDEWVSAWEPEVAVIEWCHSMIGQGVSSSFSFGRACGAVEAVAMVHAGRIDWVSASVWKKHFGLTSSKQASLDLAKRVYGSSWRWHKKVEDGIAEAALLCQWYLDKKVQ